MLSLSYLKFFSLASFLNYKHESFFFLFNSTPYCTKELPLICLGRYTIHWQMATVSVRVRLQSADTRSLRWDSSTRVNSVSDFQNARVLMSSLLPSLPTGPVIRHSTELHSDPCCDKAEQVKREIETLIDLNLLEHLFMQLSGRGYICQLSPWEAEPSCVAISVVFWFAAVFSRQAELFFSP